MKHIITALISILILSSSIYSQSNVDSVLIEIEKNNTTLSALQKRAEADKIGNKTGIYLQNPEVGLNYLWGDPSSIGNRIDFSIKQTFDFPTAYRYRYQISRIQNEQVELEYQKARRVLLLEIRLICNDLIYTNALLSELYKRFNHAESISSSYKAKFDIGETNILEYNKAQLNLLNIRKDLESQKIKRDALLGELARLNGGIFINFTDSIFQEPELSTDFEQWYIQAEQSNPLLNWLTKEIEISQKQVNLKRALSFPKLQAGYMSENIVGQEFQGLIVGLSIPLWENKNTVKYSKANTIALENITTDNKMQLYNQLKILHKKATALQNNVNDYRAQLQTFNNSELLIKALNKGEITLIGYFLELSIYYESVNKLLELERDMNKAVVVLNQYM